MGFFGGAESGITFGDFFADGSVPMTGNLNMGNNDIINAQSLEIDTGSGSPSGTITGGIIGGGAGSEDLQIRANDDLYLDGDIIRFRDDGGGTVWIMDAQGRLKGQRTSNNQLESKHQVSTTNADSGSLAIYAKSDDRWYQKDSSGGEEKLAISSEAMLLDGSNTMTGDLNLGSNDIDNAGASFSILIGGSQKWLFSSSGRLVGFDTTNGGIDIKHQTGIATPPSSQLKIYPESDNRWHQLSNTGVPDTLSIDSLTMLLDGSNAMTSDLNLGANTLQVSGTQVVGSRKTGWGAATGTATRTTFVTSSVTLEQLAERVKAIIDDDIAHGLFGA